MDIVRFIQILPLLYEDWGLPSMQPKTERFSSILEQVKQPTTTNLLQLLNLAVDCLEKEEVYGEIGCLEGANLIGALLNHSQALAYAIEQFSTIPEAINFQVTKLEENLRNFDVLDQICFSHLNIESFFAELKAIDCEDRFGVYHYNFEPDYRSVLLSLLLGKSFWSDQAIIIVNNASFPAVKQAINDFLACEDQGKLILDWQSSRQCVFGGNGLCLLVWDTQQDLAGLTSQIIQEIEPEKAITNSREFLAQAEKKLVLHVGCGPYNSEALPGELRTWEWQEIRLDIDPAVNPDILGTITDLSAVPDHSVDAVYSSHNLEHIYDYEVPMALAEFKRVLKVGGLTWLVVPDIQQAAEWVIKGDIDEQPLYLSAAGPVHALWMFYGMGTSIPGIPYMAHKTGFTSSSLLSRLTQAGFANIEVSRGNFNVYAKAYK